MGATADCEAIGMGFFGQPTNAITSLALVVAGLIVLRRAREQWVAGGLAATGIGSFLFHGPLAPGGDWVHDVTLAWLILIIGLRTRQLDTRGGLLALAAIAPLFLVLGEAADVLTSVLMAITVLLLLAGGRGVHTLGPVMLFATSAVIGRLGASDGPLCDPESLLQPHGLWHIGAAVAVGWWAMRLSDGDPPGPRHPSARHPSAPESRRSRSTH